MNKLKPLFYTNIQQNQSQPCLKEVYKLCKNMRIHKSCFLNRGPEAAESPHGMAYVCMIILHLSMR